MSYGVRYSKEEKDLMHKTYATIFTNLQNDNFRLLAESWINNIFRSKELNLPVLLSLVNTPQERAVFIPSDANLQPTVQNCPSIGQTLSDILTPQVTSRGAYGIKQYNWGKISIASIEHPYVRSFELKRYYKENRGVVPEGESKANQFRRELNKMKSDYSLLCASWQPQQRGEQGDHYTFFLFGSNHQPFFHHLCQIKT